jgi:DNA-binding NarL/FixJ family response regulator
MNAIIKGTPAATTYRARHFATVSLGAAIPTTLYASVAAMIRIAIADDHAIVRKGLKQIIGDAQDMIVAGEAATADELMALVRSHPFDIVVLDLTLGPDNGLDVLKHIKNEFPRLPVLILSMHAEELFATRAFRSGASGYTQKESAPADLIHAIHRIAAGGMYVSSEMGVTIAQEFRRGRVDALPHERLSNREFEVFQLLGSGKSVSHVARLLGLSVKTVSTHRSRILEKTGLRNNAEIIHYVISNRLQEL